VRHRSFATNDLLWRTDGGSSSSSSSSSGGIIPWFGDGNRGTERIGMQHRHALLADRRYERGLEWVRVRVNIRVSIRVRVRVRVGFGRGKG
jgi:hypothetical protein